MSWSGKRTVAATVVLAGAAAAATMAAAVSAVPGPVPVPEPVPAVTAAAPAQASASASGPATPGATPTPTRTPTPAPAVLSVYSNNIENLVEDTPDGRCRRISAADHLASMLVDDSGQVGTIGVVAPDLLLLQQVGGRRDAQAYADAVSAAFGYPVGTYRALVAWADPEPWGEEHGCDVADLSQEKSRQTNGIVYNSRTLTLAGDPVTWAAGWLRPGTRYAAGAGCTAYEPPSVDRDPLRRHKWKRSAALAARFTVTGTGTSVFAASMHLPHHNGAHACAGDGDPGVSGTGVRLPAAAERLLTASAVRVLGIDANRAGIAPDALQRYGVTGYGEGRTVGRRTKIDYLFVRGAVRPSTIGHTVDGTRSTHRALYGFIDL